MVMFDYTRLRRGTKYMECADIVSVMKGGDIIMSPRMVHEHHEFRNRVYSLLPWLASSLFLLLAILGIAIYSVWFSPGAPARHPSTAAQPGAGPTASQPKPNVSVTQVPNQPKEGQGPSIPVPSAQPPGATPKQAASPPPPPPPAPAALAPAKVLMVSDNTYDPQTISVSAGNVVQWVNKDDKPHTVTADTGNGPNSDAKFPDGIPAGKSYTWKVPADAASGTTYYYHSRFEGQPGDGIMLGQGLAGSVVVK